MGPDRKSDIMHWLRKGKQPIGIFLLLALLWGGVLFPLGRRIGRGCQQQRQLQQRLQHLAAFARSWNPQEAREEASHLTKVRKKREAPVSRENWLEALTQTNDKRHDHHCYPVDDRHSRNGSIAKGASRMVEKHH